MIFKSFVIYKKSKLETENVPNLFIHIMEENLP